MLLSLMQEVYRESAMIELKNYIENTLLSPDADDEKLEKFFEISKEYEVLGVCINPVHVKKAKKFFKSTNTKIVTVVGFPLGANLSETKALEAQKAIEDGADEIDMVLNIGSLKSKDYDFVKKDIKTVKTASEDKILKVIIETDLLTKEEIKKACELCIDAHADFVKTSTGFVKNGIGAKAEDIKLMSEIVKPHGLRVKASGGIKTLKQAMALIEAGADRLGTSSGKAILDELKEL